MNGHRALLQTERLQVLALRGRGRHLLATDGKVLHLILVEGKKRVDFQLYNKKYIIFLSFNNPFILVSLPVRMPVWNFLIGRLLQWRWERR